MARIFQVFSLDGGTALAVELTNLMTLQMGGYLVGFMATWDTCFSVMSKRRETDTRRAILEIQLRKCQALTPLLFQLESALASLRRKIHNYFCKSEWAEVDRRQAEVTRLQLLNPSPVAPRAAAAEAKANAKARAMAKAKAKAKTKLWYGRGADTETFSAGSGSLSFFGCSWFLLVF